MTRRTPRAIAKMALFLYLWTVPVVSVLGSPVLLWDANPDPFVAGYRVYTGTQSRTYSSVEDVGLQTSNTLAHLSAGQTYYLAVTTYTQDGLESPFSEEIVFTPRVDGLTAEAIATTINMEAGQPSILFTALVGQQCRVVASSDLETWQEVYSVTMPRTGTIRYVDESPNAPPMRFYRTIVSPVLSGLPNTDGVL